VVLFKIDKKVQVDFLKNFQKYRWIFLKNPESTGGFTLKITGGGA
jgi:hypothetical protein